MVWFVGQIKTYFDFGMVWSNTEPDETKGHGQLLVHVNFGVMKHSHQLLSCVETRRSRADDGDPRTWAIVLCLVMEAAKENASQ